MKRYRDLKIGAKLVIAAGLLVVLAVTSLTVIIGVRVFALSRENASLIARETAAHYANIVKADIEIALNEARALGAVFESAVNSDGVSLSRDEANAVLKYFIEKNKNFLGAYVLFEPDKFDGMDKSFINAPGHDATGRFIPYWTRDDNGKGVLAALVDYEIQGAGDYYQIPKTRNRDRKCLS